MPSRVVGRSTRTVASAEELAANQFLRAHYVDPDTGIDLPKSVDAAAKWLDQKAFDEGCPMVPMGLLGASVAVTSVGCVLH